MKKSISGLALMAGGLILGSSSALAAVGTITEYNAPGGVGCLPAGIVAGPDGNLWFNEFNTNKVVKATTSGVFTEYTIPTANTSPLGITVGPDGNLWFTERGANKVAKVTTSGAFTEYNITTASSGASNITAGPDGNLWFVETNIDKVAKVTTGGVVTEYTIPTVGGGPNDIVLGPDGNLWFTEFADQVAKVTTSGAFTEYTVPTTGGHPEGIAKGPDGNLWITEFDGNKVAKVTTSGGVTEYTVPTATSQPIGITTGPDGNLWFVEQAGNAVTKGYNGGRLHRVRHSNCRQPAVAHHARAGREPLVHRAGWCQGRQSDCDGSCDSLAEPLATHPAACGPGSSHSAPWARVWCRDPGREWNASGWRLLPRQACQSAELAKYSSSFSRNTAEPLQPYHLAAAAVRIRSRLWDTPACRNICREPRGRRSCLWVPGRSSRARLCSLQSSNLPPQSSAQLRASSAVANQLSNPAGPSSVLFSRTRYTCGSSPAKESQQAACAGRAGISTTNCITSG